MRHKYKIAAIAIISLSFFVGASFALEGEEVDKLRAKEAEHKCKVLRALKENDSKREEVQAQRSEELAYINEGDDSWKKDCE